MGTGNPWLYFSTTRWHLRGKSGPGGLVLRKIRLNLFFAKRKRVKPREKRRSPVKPRQTSTFLWIFVVVCLCILRTNKTWDFTGPELPTSQTATRVTQRTTSVVTWGSSWFFGYTSYEFKVELQTANMDTWNLWLLFSLMMCFGIIVETSFSFIFKHGMLRVVFEPISENNWPHWSRW